MATANRIVTFHGIRQRDFGYALPLLDRIGASGPDQSLSVNWGDLVADDLLHWRSLEGPPARRWGHPIWNWKRRLLAEINQSLGWVRAYEDPDTQRRILGEVSSRIIDEMEDGARTFCFIGHSLGSVILVDAIQHLVTGGILAPSQIRGIVTMGSPLHHWKAPKKLAAILRGIPLSGQWANIYDVDDAVGGRLHSLDIRIKDVEVNTGNLFASHVSYWNSKTVAEIVRGVFTFPPDPVAEIVADVAGAKVITEVVAEPGKDGGVA